METTSPTARSTHGFAILVVTAAVALGAAAPAHCYGWPVKPFHRQHPIRSYLGDPRMGTNVSKPAFVHFGVDISAPNNTPVYATISGRISVHPLHPDTVVMVTSGSTTFEYWHLHPAVTSGYAVAYKTVLGTIISPCLHVHFSERHGSTYVNPLRPAGLEPYRDTTRPSVDRLFVSRDGSGYGISVQAHDLPPLAVPAPWNDLPLTPALIQWRLRPRGTTASWATADDFRGSLPTTSADTIYVPSTRQNKARLPGTYRVWLVRGWRPPPGTYVVDVRVADTSGNSALRSTIVQVSSASVTLSR